jgi:uncharacterized protein (TIGR02118 family)
MTVKITITFWEPSDPEAFERHYVETHAPLVRALPGLRAYEYGRALTNFDGSPPDAYWVVSLTFDDVEAMHASFASPPGQKTTADMPRFITGPMKSVVSEVR